MSRNRNIQVSEKVFYWVGGEKRVPRVRIVIQGKICIFGCDKKLNPLLVSEDEHAHPQIKRTAYAHAAKLFEQELGRDASRVHVPQQLTMC